MKVYVSANLSVQMLPQGNDEHEWNLGKVTTDEAKQLLANHPDYAWSIGRSSTATVCAVSLDVKPKPYSTVNMEGEWLILLAQIIKTGPDPLRWDIQWWTVYPIHNF